MCACVLYSLASKIYCNIISPIGVVVRLLLLVLLLVVLAVMVLVTYCYVLAMVIVCARCTFCSILRSLEPNSTNLLHKTFDYLFTVFLFV